MSGRLRGRSQRGMTLIEVVVALGIWGLMGTMVAGIMFSTIDTQESVLGLQARYHAGRVALDRMRKEITMTFVSLHQADDKRTRTVFNGDDHRLLFNTAANEPLARNTRQSDQLEVEYKVERVRNEDDKLVNALVRRVKYHIDDRPGSGGRREILVEGVKELEIAYFDKYRERWLNDWDVEVEDAPAMRAKLRQLQSLREQAEAVTDDENSGAAGVVVGAEADKQVDEAQAELIDGLVLPSRVKIRLVLEDPSDKETEHVMETQVEITMIEPLWY